MDTVFIATMAQTVSHNSRTHCLRQNYLYLNVKSFTHRKSNNAGLAYEPSDAREPSRTLLALPTGGSGPSGFTLGPVIAWNSFAPSVT